MIALAASLAAFWICAAAGAAGAWLMRRRTMLSIRNLYLAAAAGALTCAIAVLARWWDALLVIGPLAAGPTTGALVGRRWRMADLGAGEELRAHELAAALGVATHATTSNRRARLTSARRERSSASARGRTPSRTYR